MFALVPLFAIGAQNVATTPADKLSVEWWKNRHTACVETTKKGGIDLAFVGDSITQGWESAGKPTWDKYYAGRNAANFGFSGDQTQHVIWRLQNGELVGLNPKVIVIMIGTNNIGARSSTPEQAADGVKSIVSILRKEIPKAKILLLGVFPRGTGKDHPDCQAVDKISAGYKGLEDGKHVFFEDVGRFFLYRTNGEMRRLLMPDLLHPNAAGYEIWGKAMERKLAELLAMP